MRKVSLNVLEFDKKSRYIFNEFDNDDSEHIEKIKNNIQFIIENDLTKRQKQLIELYYFDNIKIEDIAKMLKINVSTVSRTIKRGKKRLYERLKCLM